jgi:hypothetical protein
VKASSYEQTAVFSGTYRALVGDPFFEDGTVGGDADVVVEEEGADTTPPAAITDLAASNPTPSTIDLTWTAPGDDDNTGTAATYDIRYLEGTTPITDANWAAAIQCTGESTPQGAGSSETFTVIGLSAATDYCFAIKTADEVPNLSPISNSPSGSTTAGPDEEPPVVSNPTADPDVIPDDTDNNPLWGESSTLTVTVTDESAITSVTVDLSSIGGSGVQPMTNTGGDVWAVPTNASAGTDGWTGTAYVPYQLQVTATDEHGLSNTAVSIPLTVIKNGDVSSDGVTDSWDCTYLARSLAGFPGYPLVEEVAEVSGDSVVDSWDVTYLTRHLAGIPGYDKLK